MGVRKWCGRFSDSRIRFYVIAAKPILLLGLALFDQNAIRYEDGVRLNTAVDPSINAHPFLLFAVFLHPLPLRRCIRTWFLPYGSFIHYFEDKGLAWYFTNCIAYYKEVFHFC